MRYLIRTKLILLIGIPVVLTYLVVMAFDILRVRQRVEHETELRMANLVQNYAKRFDAQVARSTRTFVEIHPEISSEQIYAQLRANLVQNYLNEMAAIGNKHGGTLDKFMGDGIMGFFCDPECSGTVQDAVQCVHMAQAMQERAAGLQIAVHIGINSGEDRRITEPT